LDPNNEPRREKNKWGGGGEKEKKIRCPCWLGEEVNSRQQAKSQKEQKRHEKEGGGKKGTKRHRVSITGEYQAQGDPPGKKKMKKTNVGRGGGVGLRFGERRGWTLRENVRYTKGIEVEEPFYEGKTDKKAYHNPTERGDGSGNITNTSCQANLRGDGES